MKWIRWFFYRAVPRTEALIVEHRRHRRSLNDDSGHHPVTESYEKRTKALIDHLLSDGSPEKKFRLPDNAGIVRLRHWSDRFRPEEKFQISYFDWNEKDEWGCPMEYSFTVDAHGAVMRSRTTQAHLEHPSDDSQHGLRELKITHWQERLGMESFLVRILVFTVENRFEIPANSRIGANFPDGPQR